MAYRGSYGMGMGLTPWVQRLLIANTIVFLMQVGTQHQLTSHLQFVPALTLLKPWTLVTYMFAHGSFMHLLFNMLGLFFFGPPLEARWGSSEFIRYYLICGLGGALLSFLFAFGAPIIGASAAVYGVMLGFAMNWPDQPIYIWAIFPVPAKYLVIFLAFMSFLSMTGGSGDNIAHAAHLGGFAAGFLYLKLNRGGGMVSGWRRKLTQRRMHVVRTDEPERRPTAPAGAGAGAGTARRSAAEAVQLDELDRVLDKISTQGIHSLTPEERRLLDDVSRRYRQN
jgi:membrane associated rhomboid family serine protease